MKDTVERESKTTSRRNIHTWIVTILTVIGLSGLGAYACRRSADGSRLLRASHLAARQQWTAVIQELEPYLRRHAEDEEAIALLARAHEALGNHLASAQSWEKVASDSPRKRSALIAQGTALLAAHRATDAEQAWQGSLILAESCGDNLIFHQAIEQLAMLYWLQGRKSDIQRLVARGLDRAHAQRDVAEHLNGLKWQLRVRLLDMDPVEAIETLKLCVDADESDCESGRGLARYLTCLGMYEEARRYFLHCLIQRPHDLRNWLDFLVMLIDCGDLETAGRIIERLPESAREIPAFQAEWGRWELAIGNPAAAEAAFRRVLLKNPHDERALTQLANSLRQANQPAQLAEQVIALKNKLEDRLRLQHYYLQLQQSWQPSSNESLSIALLCSSLGFMREAEDWKLHAATLNPAAATTREFTTRAIPMVHSEDWSWADAPPVDQFVAASESPRKRDQDPTEFRFTDVAQQAGVNFSYFRGETGQFWIVEPNGGGVAWIDTRQDGWLDLLFIDGCPLLPGTENHQTAPTSAWSSRLFRNDGHGQFDDCTRDARLTTNFYGQGCTVADFDNDGFPDIYVTGYGATALLHNRGDGTFCDVTAFSGTSRNAFNTGCAFMDLNRDGNLDLYVVSYVDFDPALHGKPCRNASTGEFEYCGPRCCPGMPDTLFMGNGDGTFRDVSASTGVSAETTAGFAVVSADLNNDHWPDLYVANDGQPNTVWLNESATDSAGRIRLRSCGLELGCALDANGLAQASMGIACGDVDHDGLLDLGVSNYYYEHYTLYRSHASQGFEDVSVPYQIAGATRTTMGWGTEFVDCDNDGWLDLFIANGHINRFSNGTTPYEILPQLFRNSKNGKFIDVGQTAGPYFRTPHVARGAAFGDYDNDGLEDIAVVHHHRPSALLHNETSTNGASIVLKLIGCSSTRDAMNARVFATIRGGSSSPNVELMREITPGTSYLSANDYRVRIGLGTASQADIRVLWPSGREQTWHNLRPGETNVLREMCEEVSNVP